MTQRRGAAEALQRRALSRMLGLSLRSSFGAWRRLTASMISARCLLRRHLLALQQETFTAWRCALPCCILLLLAEPIIVHGQSAYICLNLFSEAPLWPIHTKNGLTSWAYGNLAALLR